MTTKHTKKSVLIYILIILCVFFVAYAIIAYSGALGNKLEYQSELIDDDLKENKKENEDSKEILAENLITNPEIEIPATHIETPDAVKALYMSSWVAGSNDFRNSLIKIIDETELNAVVIDIKDSTGRVSFKINDPEIEKYGSVENRIRNIRNIIETLHAKNIYVIGRISVFQDPYMTKIKPEWAIKRLSDGGVWKDRKGLSFLDPTKKEVHDYTLKIALESYKLGFDEINLDYIRYPSDGNMKDINYNLKEGKTRADNIEEFFKYFSTELKKETNIPLSADLFGLTTEAVDDMGIGQVWEKALPYFDYLAPMVYPSHYPSGYSNFTNPAAHPYEVIDRSIKGAITKTELQGSNIAKIRPWLQDFDMGATYTKELVRAQIKATYDNGLTSWMLWDPANKYTPSALLVEKNN